MSFTIHKCLKSTIKTEFIFYSVKPDKSSLIIRIIYFLFCLDGMVPGKPVPGSHPLQDDPPPTYEEAVKVKYSSSIISSLDIDT